MYEEYPTVTMTFLFWKTKAPGVQGGNKTLGIVEEQTVFIQKVWFQTPGLEKCSEIPFFQDVIGACYV